MIINVALPMGLGPMRAPIHTQGKRALMQVKGRYLNVQEERTHTCKEKTRVQVGREDLHMPEGRNPGIDLGSRTCLLLDLTMGSLCKRPKLALVVV